LYDAIVDHYLRWHVVYIILGEWNELKVDAMSLWDCLIKYFVMFMHDNLFVMHFGYFIKSW